MQLLFTLMNSNKSILIPSNFFNQDYKVKIDKLNNSNVETLYLFDHTINPITGLKDVYNFLDGFEILNNFISSSKYVGSCVLNINSRSILDFKKHYLKKLSNVKNFKLGLGIGDSLFENNNKFHNELNEIIEEIVNIKSKSFASIFLGGNSKIILETSMKYSLGLNQWLGTNEHFEKKIKLFKNLKNPKGNLSRCVGLNFPKNQDEKEDFERIYIFKDTNTEIFLQTVDNIFK